MKVCGGDSTWKWRTKPLFASFYISLFCIIVYQHYIYFFPFQRCSRVCSSHSSSNDFILFHFVCHLLLQKNYAFSFTIILKLISSLLLLVVFFWRWWTLSDGCVRSRSSCCDYEWLWLQKLGDDLTMLQWVFSFLFEIDFWWFI